MIRFVTETGSTYEVDDVGKRVRRLDGTSRPTARQGKDGSWRSYADISHIAIGRPVSILWSGDTPLLEGSPVGATPATVTSRVIEVFDGQAPN